MPTQRNLLIRRVAGLCTIMLLAVTAGAAAATPAQAFTRLGCKFTGTNPAMHYKIEPMVSQRNRAATRAGAKLWNSSNVAAPGSFYQWQPGREVIISVREANFADPTLWARASGQCTAEGNWTGNHATITWAKRGSGRLTPSQLGVVAAHEMGHVLGLGHMPPSRCGAKRSVMRQGQITWSCGWGSSPWSDDVRGVRALY